MNDRGGNDIFKCIGSTPIEAVANLFIALKQNA